MLVAVKPPLGYKTAPLQAGLFTCNSGVFFAEIGIDGGGFGKVLTRIMLRFFAEIVTRNRPVVTHNSGPNFTFSSLLLVEIVLIFHLFLRLPADEAG